MTSQELHEELVALKARIDGVITSAKILVPIVGCVIAVLAGVVGWDYKKLSDAVNVGKNLEAELATIQRLRRDYAKARQENIVANMEAVFDEQVSLDSIRKHPEVLPRLQSLRNDLQNIVGIEPGDKTTYSFLVDALEAYLKKDWHTALESLDKISQDDRHYFTYAQMRGACLLRIDEPKEAAEWFKKAEGLATEKRTAQQSMNARGVAMLYDGRASKNEDRIREAIGVFNAILLYDKDYPPTYFNLACCYAQLREYDKVTEQLMESLKHKRTKEELIETMRDDLDIETEKFLAGYVKEYLRVSIPTMRQDWPTETALALQRKAADLQLASSPGS